MTTLDWLDDRADPRVIAALERRCGICRAEPGVDCRHPWETSEQLGRVVHLSRAESHMDKRKRGA